LTELYLFIRIQRVAVNKCLLKLGDITFRLSAFQGHQTVTPGLNRSAFFFADSTPRKEYERFIQLLF